MKIRVVARLVAQTGIQAKGFIQVLERIFHVPGEAIERSQAIDDKVGLRRLL